MEKGKITNSFYNFPISNFVDTTHFAWRTDTTSEFEAFADGRGFDKYVNQLRNNTEVIAMFADNEHYGHLGLFENTWVRGADISLGGVPCYDGDEEEYPCGEENGEDGTKSVSLGNGKNNLSRGPGGSSKAVRAASGGGIDKVSKSKSTAYSVGLAIPIPFSIGVSRTKSTTILYNDLMDLNGDGYPTAITAG